MEPAIGRRVRADAPSEALRPVLQPLEAPPADDLSSSPVVSNHLVAIAAEVGGLAVGVNILGQFTDVSIYATNLIALIGLGVAIDYSLFIVSRFREELAGGRMVPDALATTAATAGRAIVFSGVTVAICLCGLLFFQGTFIASMGAAAAIAGCYWPSSGR